MDVCVTGTETTSFATSGTVVAVTDRTVRVWTGDGTVDARRAVSCLVAPEEGDVVLLVDPGAAGASSGSSGVVATSFVIAVLERPSRTTARICMEGDVIIEVDSGRLTIAATAGVDVQSDCTVSIAADAIDARAREGTLLLGSARLVAGALDTIIDRLSQAVKRAYRHVEQVDHLRAGQIDYAAEGLTRLHGEHTLVTARELVKADGRQIHFG